MMRNKKLVFLLGGVCLLTALFLSMRLGSQDMSLKEFLLGLFRKSGYERASFVLWTLRFPRAVAAVLAGAGLSVSGLALQNITGNDLAGPNIIGVNAGAGFFVILSMYLFPDLFSLTPIFAFSGAVLSSLFIIALGHRSAYNKSTLILAGVAVTALLNAGISLISLLDTDLLSSYNAFSIGGLSGSKLKEMYLPLGMIFVSFTLLFVFSKDIDAMTLGDDIARNLGVKTGRTRLIVCLSASASAAAVVSFAGLLGFVGLIVPHMARRLFGNGSRISLLGCALLGVIIVLLADTVGRASLPGTEVPVGIVMAIIGVPFFLYLIFRRRRHD